MRPTFDDLRQDLALSARKLLKRRGFAAIAVLSLALGIGANTAIFSVVNQVLLRGLPYAGGDALVRVWETFPMASGSGRGSVSTPNWVDWQAQSTSFASLGGYSYTSFNLMGDDAPTRIVGTAVTPEIFPLLGTPAALGRFLGEGDGMHDRVTVLGHGLWQRLLGGDLEVVGRQVRLDGEAFTVVGVMPEGFTFPPRSRAEMWTPLVVSDSLAANRGSHWMSVVGRVREGVPLAAARRDLETVAARIAQAYPEQQEGRSVQLAPLAESVVAQRRPALLALWGASGLILLIACGNVANLLLARAAGRHRELAVRAALGAGRGRLARLVLIESALLAVAGGAMGLVVGVLAVHSLARLPGNSLGGQAAVFDARVFAGCALASLIAALVAGWVPAVRASRTDLQAVMKDRAATGARVRRDPMRVAWVVAEIALALVVVIGAGLLVRTLAALEAVDPGFRGEHVQTMRVPLPGHYDTAEEIGAFYSTLLRQVNGLPGVVSAGTINMLPVQSWGRNGNFLVEGRPPMPPAQQPFAEMRVVGGDYFASLGIATRGGRTFGAQDHAEAAPTAVINETAARRYWPDDDPVGQRIGFGGDTSWTVVGVVGDVRNAGLREAVRAEIYFADAQAPSQEMSLVVRTVMDPAAAVAPIREAVRALDPEIPLYRVATLDDVVTSSLAGTRFNGLLFSLFAGLAIILATLGIYGVVSYSVSQRTGEIGVRMALGAARRNVVGLVVRQGLNLGAVGTVVGLAAAGGLTRFLRSQLYGVEAIDAVTFAAAAGGVLLVAVVACLVPARRAASVSPTVALRAE